MAGGVYYVVYHVKSVHAAEIRSGNDPALTGCLSASSS